MNGMDYWRLCDELTVAQAALLIADVNPSGEIGAHCENWRIDERPDGYEAAKAAISKAVRSGKVEGTLIPIYLEDPNFPQRVTDPILVAVDIDRSTIEVDSLKAWLSSRGIRDGFFFPDARCNADYLDSSHPRYSKKLAAAVLVWQAMDDENLLSGKAPKVAMEEWLGVKYKELGLTWQEEKSNQAISDVASIANWHKAGPAKTPGA